MRRPVSDSQATTISSQVVTTSHSSGRAPSGSIFGCRRRGPSSGANGFAGIEAFTCPNKALLRSAWAGSLWADKASRSSGSTSFVMHRWRQKPFRQAAAVPRTEEPYGYFGGILHGCPQGIGTWAPTALM